MKNKEMYKIVAIIFGVIILGEYLFILFSQQGQHENNSNFNYTRENGVVKGILSKYKHYLLTKINRDKARELVDKYNCITSFKTFDQYIVLTIEKNCSVYEISRKIGIDTLADAIIHVNSTMKIGGEEYYMPSQSLDIRMKPSYKENESLDIKIDFLAKGNSIVGIYDYSIIPKLVKMEGSGLIYNISKLRCILVINETNKNKTKIIEKLRNELGNETKIKVSNDTVITISKNVFEIKDPDVLIKNCTYNYNIKLKVRGKDVPLVVKTNKRYKIGSVVRTTYYTYPGSTIAINVTFVE